MSAFKDFTPGQGGASAAPAAAASDEPAEEPAEEDEGEDEEVAESSGGGGDYPPHSVMGLPALSPTMSQGTAPPLYRNRLPWFVRLCPGLTYSLSQVYMRLAQIHISLLRALCFMPTMHGG